MLACMNYRYKAIIILDIAVFSDDQHLHFCFNKVLNLVTFVK